MKKIRFLAFLSAALLLLSACGDVTPAVTTAPSATTVEPTTTDAPQTAAPTTEAPSTTEAPATTDAPAVVDPVTTYVNPLTGLASEKDLAGVRPISLSVDNVHKAQPTLGLSLADVVIQLPFEGYETRVVAVYNDYENLPAVGNIRSARDYSVRYAADFDSILVHAGTDSDVGSHELALNAIRYGFPVSYLIKQEVIQYAAEREDLWTGGYETINGLEYYPEAMYRDSYRDANFDYEHATVITGAIIKSCIKYKNYRTTLRTDYELPYEIGETNPSAFPLTATDILLKYNPYTVSDYGVHYIYDTEKALYAWNEYDNEPHIDDITDEPIYFKNVIILFVPVQRYANDAKNRLNVDYVGTGEGYYMVNGKAQKIRWIRPDADATLILTTEDGAALSVEPGKIMMNIFPKDYQNVCRLPK